MRLTRLLAAALVLAAYAVDSEAQLGSGWVAYSPTVKIHLDGETGDPTTFDWKTYQSNCSPSICADYRYDSTTDTETFRILDNRSNRSEIRVYNDYSTGRRQFQGYVTFGAPLDDESLMQIWGSTTGATQLMLRGYAASGGSISGGGASITGIYGVETRVNVIHNQGDRVLIYFNGSKRGEFVDDEVVSNYHKYGCYGTLRTGAVTVRWRQVRHYRDGNPPGSATPTPSPTPSGSFSGYYRIMARHSGKALAVQSASTANSANVFQWTYGGTTHQRRVGAPQHRQRLLPHHQPQQRQGHDGGRAPPRRKAPTSSSTPTAARPPTTSGRSSTWAAAITAITNRNSGKSAEVAGGSTARRRRRRPAHVRRRDAPAVPARLGAVMPNTGDSSAAARVRIGGR